MRPRKSIVLALAGMLAFSLGGNVGAREATRSVVTTEAAYLAGSPEVHEVQRWLLAHAGLVEGRRIGDPGTLGDVQVIHTANVPGAQIAGPGDGPPVSLPSSGNAGDTITITSSSGGWTQTWSYQGANNGTLGQWVLIRYEYFQTNRR